METETFRKNCIVVPKPCLLKGLHLLFNSDSKGTDFLFLSNVLPLCLHFGNVSSQFRTMVIASMTKLCEGKTILERHFRSSFIQRFLTRGSVYVGDFLFKSSIHEFITPNPDLKFDAANVSTLCISDKNQQFLHTLALYHCLRHLEITLLSLGNSFFFPSSLGGLLSLKVVGSRGILLDSVSINVKELASLTSIDLIMRGTTRAVVFGLNCLCGLDSIHVERVSSCDGLHPLARIQRAVVEEVENVCLEILFRNRENYQFCELSLVNIDIPASLEWIKSSILTNYTFNLSFNGPRCELFSTKDFSFLQELHFLSYQDDVVTLEIVSPNNLDVLRVNGLVDVNFNSSFHVETLFLRGLTSKNVYNCLVNCPYVRQLYLSDFTTTNEESIMIKKVDQLKYLRVLDLCNVFGFLSNFSSLPKLVSLSLSEVENFDINILFTKFPFLENLSLEECVIQGSSQPNCYLKFLTISQCEVINGFSVISEFSNLKLLKVKLLKEDAIFDLQLPKSLKNIQCLAFFPCICRFLISVHSTCTVTVDLRVPFGVNVEERESCQTEIDSWVANYLESRPTRCCTFKLEIES
ncbi:hypothetical protein RCL1_008804 [Eukaryota sp. TZLM3-RCL]